MRAVILAGGLGTRLRPLVADVPKPLALINGKPFLEILMNSLCAKGVTSFLISSGYMGNKIQEFFGSNFQGREILYNQEQTRLGTGGAIAASLELITEPFAIVLNGDTFLDFSENELLYASEDHDIPKVFLTRVDESRQFGVVEVANGAIAKFSEKSNFGPSLINAGVYVLPKVLFEGKHVNPPFSFEEFLSSDVRKRKYMPIESRGMFIDIGTPSDLQRARSIFINEEYK